MKEKHLVIHHLSLRFKPSDNFDGDDFDKQRDSENKYSKIKMIFRQKL